MARRADHSKEELTEMVVVAARDIIAQICWNAGSSRDLNGDGGRIVVTKVKTMAGEEIELNHYLE